MKGKWWIIIAAVILVLIDSVAMTVGTSSFISEDWAVFIAKIINFLIFAYILYKVAWGKIKTMFVDRAAEIGREMEQYKALYEEAEKEIAVLRQKVEKISSEREAILAAYEEEAKITEQAFLAKAKDDVARLRSESLASLKDDFEMKYESIVRDVIDTVMERVEKAAGAIGSETQQKLKDDFIAQLGKLE